MTDQAETATANVDDLMAWVAQVSSGVIAASDQVVGGNRCLSWAVDVRGADGRVSELYLRYQPPRPPSVEPYTVPREAGIYRAIDGTGVMAPRLIAVHPSEPAVLMERVPGRADYRRLTDLADREAVASEFVAEIVRLHALDLKAMPIEGVTPDAAIADYVRAELSIWRAMYEETGRRDALIDLALAWLDKHLPTPPDTPVLVHGDAGPGNFLFADGHLTALLDWELAHPGDPMEDLAWFSMRSVMEPVPDFAERLAEYARLSGRPFDRARFLYHRVFVSARVTIIRHRNVTGLPGASIVSRALNRRLLVEAIAAASGIGLPPPAPIDAPPTAQTALFDLVLEDMRTEIAPQCAAGSAASAVKDAVKMLKFLRESDRLGDAVTGQDLAAMNALLGAPQPSVAAGQAALVAALQAGAVSERQALGYFAGAVGREAQLAAGASGGLGTRGFPKFEREGATT